MNSPKQMLEKLKTLLNSENGKKPNKYHYL